MVGRTQAGSALTGPPPFFLVGFGGLRVDLVGVSSPLRVAGDLNLANASSLFGVPLEGIRWPLPNTPDSRSFELGVLTRPDLPGVLAGRTLLRWAYNLLYIRGGTGGLGWIGGRSRVIFRRSQAMWAHASARATSSSVFNAPALWRDWVSKEDASSRRGCGRSLE